ncbi:hypothetical protein, conserved [Leishmania tarentolae]|uniref:Transmembrane protein n=1 Tax=Leishmania tarentolae TaxID=5689 RepID=A0A640KVV8_LEITA|nr:hypothetical protein, conserved [Leishmania tarentolae]
MSSGNGEGGGGRGPGGSLPRTSAEHLPFSQGNRASDASTDITMLGGAAGINAEERPAASTTTDHVVVSLNLDDLSSSLGVRRADVLSQGLTFQARSAPSFHTTRSLLGSVLQVTGKNQLSSSPAIGATASAATTLLATDAGYNLHNVDEALSSSPQSAHYRRRHSTLRGTHLDLDPVRVPDGTIQLSLPPQWSSPSFPFVRASASSLRCGTPPPGSADALSGALSGHGGAAVVFASNTLFPIRHVGAGVAVLEHEATERRLSTDTREEVYTYRDDAPLLGGMASLRHSRSGAASGPLNPRTSALPTDDSVSRLPMLPADTEEGPLRQHADHGAATSATPGASSRRVRFSDNVISSIHVARQEEEHMRLLVVYGRPWYAYVLLILFSFFLGLSHASVMYLEEDHRALKDRAVSVAFMLFLFLGMGASTLTVHFLCRRQPDSEEEHSLIEDARQRRRLPTLWSYSVFFFNASVAAIVFSHSISVTVAVIMVISLACHLVVEHQNRDNGGDCVTRHDALGFATAGLGAALAVLGSVWQEMATDHISPGVALLSLLGWGLSVAVSGVCWTCFTRQLLEMSQSVSQRLLLSTSLVVCTVALGIETYVADVTLTSEASSSALVGVSAQTRSGDETDTAPHFWDVVLLPCRRFFPDVVVLIGGGLCFFLCWHAYHAVSFYVDHASSAACMVLGAGLSAVPLIVTRVLRTGWAAFIASAGLQGSLAVMMVGVAVAEAGAAMVMWSGLQHRREVEIRIVLEKPRLSSPRAHANT